MSSLNPTRAIATELDTWRKLSWFFFAGSSIAMLFYEYKWSAFALENRGTVSFRDWLWTSFDIVIPWYFGLVCLSNLREGVRNGSVNEAVGLKIAAWVELVAVAAYVMLAPEIQRLTALGALK